MTGKKYRALFAVTLIIVLGSVKIPALSRAASLSDNDQIPSDLSLDLDLAQKDPAPAQKQIIQSQTPQAKIVTDQGEQAVLTVKDEVPKEIELESPKDAENPQQTTSEQVVNKNVEEKNGQNGNGEVNNGAFNNAENVIPGTDILEPDDNTAPLPSSSANPISQPNQDQTKPPATPGESETPTPTFQPETTQPAPTNPSGEQSSTIPLENGSSQNAPAPAQNPSAENSNPQPASNNNSGSDNSQSQSSGSNDSSGSESSGGDNSAVQGVSAQAAQPWWQQFLNKLLSQFRR